MRPSGSMTMLLSWLLLLPLEVLGPGAVVPLAVLALALAELAFSIFLMILRSTHVAVPELAVSCHRWLPSVEQSITPILGNVNRSRLAVRGSGALDPPHTYTPTTPCCARQPSS